MMMTAKPSTRPSAHIRITRVRRPTSAPTSPGTIGARAARPHLLVFVTSVWENDLAMALHSIAAGK